MTRPAAPRYVVFVLPQGDMIASAEIVGPFRDKDRADAFADRANRRWPVSAMTWTLTDQTGGRTVFDHLIDDDTEGPQPDART